MSAVQIIPMSEVQPGDRVCLAGETAAFENSKEVVRLDGGAALVVRDGSGERRVSIEQVQSAMRVISRGL